MLIGQLAYLCLEHRGKPVVMSISQLAALLASSNRPSSQVNSGVLLRSTAVTEAMRTSELSLSP